MEKIRQKVSFTLEWWTEKKTQENFLIFKIKAKFFAATKMETFQISMRSRWLQIFSNNSQVYHSEINSIRFNSIQFPSRHCPQITINRIFHSKDMKQNGKKKNFLPSLSIINFHGFLFFSGLWLGKIGKVPFSRAQRRIKEWERESFSFACLRFCLIITKENRTVRIIFKAIEKSSDSNCIMKFASN